MPHEGVELSRSTLADWVGESSALLRPLVEALAEHVLSADKLHADDTPVPVLYPGARHDDRRRARRPNRRAAQSSMQPRPDSDGRLRCRRPCPAHPPRLYQIICATTSL